MKRFAFLLVASLAFSGCAQADVDCLPSLVGEWDTVLPAVDDGGKTLAPAARKASFGFKADGRWSSTAYGDDLYWLTMEGRAECIDGHLTLHTEGELDDDARRPGLEEKLELRTVEKDRLDLYMPRLSATLTLVRKKPDTAGAHPVEQPANAEQDRVLGLLRCASFAGAGQVLGIPNAGDPKRFEDAARKSQERAYGDRNYDAVMDEIFTPILMKRATNGSYDKESIRAEIARCDDQFKNLGQ